MSTVVTINDLDYQRGLKKWNVSEKELKEQVHKNTNRALEKASMKFETVENKKLGWLLQNMKH